MIIEAIDHPREANKNQLLDEAHEAGADRYQIERLANCLDFGADEVIMRASRRVKWSARKGFETRRAVTFTVTTRF